MTMTTQSHSPVSSGPSHPILRLEGVVKRYGRLVALGGVSFEVRPGEVCALIGPNGAGKTTTLKCIMGLARLAAGHIWIDGRPHHDPGARMRVALVPEVPAVYELLTVWEHLEFVARAYRLEGWRDRAAELLKRFELDRRRRDLASTLSKGMRQRLLIVAALLHDPALVLFDEPFTGLDPHAQRELRQVMLELRDRGKAVLVSAHMLDTVERLSDRALILHRGRLIAEGSLEALRARYRLPSTVPLEEVFFEATQRDEAAAEREEPHQATPGGETPA